MPIIHERVVLALGAGQRGNGRQGEEGMHSERERELNAMQTQNASHTDAAAAAVAACVHHVRVDRKRERERKRTHVLSPSLSWMEIVDEK